MIPRGAIRVLVLATAWLLAAPQGHLSACDVPVFRFALERWEPDPYVAVILHEGALSAEEQAAAAILTQATTQPEWSTMLETMEIDLQSPHPDWADGLAEGLGRALPCVVLLYPETPAFEGGPPVQDYRPRVAWCGGLDRSCAQRLVESPVRRDIARRLLKGDSVVWVLLGGQEPSGDAAAAAVLNRELGRLQERIELIRPPSPEEQAQEEWPDWDERNRTSPGVPLKVAFSYIVLNPADADEEVLVSMLRGLAGEQADRSGPMAFAVFGRGRCFEPLVATEISRPGIVAISEFLCGACSCEAKELNPGVSLLISAKWDQLLDGRLAVDSELPPLTGVLPGAPAMWSEVPQTPVARPGGSGHLLTGLAAVLALAAASVLIASALLRRRTRRDRE